MKQCFICGLAMLADIRRFIQAHGTLLAGIGFGTAFLVLVALFLYGAILMELPLAERPRWSENWLWLQAGQIAKFALLGLFTALFTRLFGVMGMFRTAISDLFGDDRWLDLRNDLPALWGRISRRLFMPGFSDKTPGAQRLLQAVDAGMTGLMASRPKGYFARNVQRHIMVEWADPDARDVIIITDRVTSDLVPYVRNQSFHYEIKFAQTVDSPAAGTSVELRVLTIDGQDKRSEGNPPLIDIILDGSRDQHDLVREMRYHQKLDDDPIFLFDQDHVSLGHSVIVVIDREAKDLVVNFEEIGVEGLFIPVGQSDTIIHRQARMDRAVLPHQGYLLVFTRRGT